MPQQILQVDQAMLETALNLVSRAVSSCTMSGSASKRGGAELLNELTVRDTRPAQIPALPLHP